MTTNEIGACRRAVLNAHHSGPDRHVTAVSATHIGGNAVAGFGPALVNVLRGLAMYADAHAECFGSPLGEDYVLGESWREAVSGLRGLLNGELGGLDGGTLDRAILAMYAAAGFEGDEP